MSIYKGDILISGKGTIVVDKELSTSSTNPVENRVVASAINNVNKYITPSTNKYVETLSCNDENGVHVYSEYSRKISDANTQKLFRFFAPDRNEWSEISVTVAKAATSFNFNGLGITSLRVNGKNVYSEDYAPYVVNSFTATAGANTVSIGFSPTFVIYNDGDTAKIGTVESNGFTVNVANAGTCSYIAFR